jgi:hypothetical protein
MENTWYCCFSNQTATFFAPNYKPPKAKKESLVDLKSKRNLAEGRKNQSYRGVYLLH